MKLTDPWRHKRATRNEVVFAKNNSWSFSFRIFYAGDVTKNELRYGGLSLSLIHIPARFRSFLLTRRRGYEMVTERYLYRFLFVGVQVSCGLQKDIIIDSISFRKRQRGTFDCSNDHLNFTSVLVHSHVTNGRNWFTFNASSRV